MPKATDCPVPFPIDASRNATCSAAGHGEEPAAVFAAEFPELLANLDFAAEVQLNDRWRHLWLVDTKGGWNPGTSIHFREEGLWSAIGERVCKTALRAAILAFDEAFRNIDLELLKHSQRN